MHFETTMKSSEKFEMPLTNPFFLAQTQKIGTICHGETFLIVINHQFSDKPLV